MNILFVIAHPDDEAYGPAGTIAELAKEHDVTVHCLCNGARPGWEHVSDARVEAFIRSCELLGANCKIGNSPDLSLELLPTVRAIEEVIQSIQPTVVYTQNISDINQDHRIVGEACLIACRPKPDSVVDELYFFEVPSSTDWTFYQVQPKFEPSVYNDITNQIELKQRVLGLYVTETYEFPDARSIEAMTTLAKYRGYQVGVHYAEAFRLVFSRNRKSQ